MMFKFPFNFSNTTNNVNNNTQRFEPLKVISMTLVVSGIVRIVIESFKLNEGFIFQEQFTYTYITAGKIFGYGLWALAIYVLIKLVEIKWIKKN